MKTKALFVLCLMTGIVIGCAREQLGEGAHSSDADNQVVKSTHTVPVEQAIENLNSLLRSIDKGTKGSNDIRVIKTVGTVSVSDLGTKAGNLPADCDELLYVVNFEEDKGYAVLAADDRIDSDVLVLADSGSKTPSDYTQSGIVPERKIYPGYPLTGEGILVDEDGEKYINPNTFQLYDETEDDYLIGDFDEGQLETEDSLSVELKTSRIEKARFIDEAVTEYAMASVLEYESDERNDNIDDVDGTDNEDISNNSNRRHPPINKPTTKVYLKDSVYVEPMLAPTAGWHQGSPYNDKCPKRKIDGKKQPADVGCVPLAVAKLMVYVNKSFNVKVDKNNQFVLSANAESLTNEQKAILCRYAGKECGSMYFRGGTFTFPNYAKGFMRRLGFKELDYSKYSADNVKEQIKKHHPVLIFAYPKSKEEGADSGLDCAHGWALDGYIERTKTVEKQYYLRGEKKIVKSTTKTDLIHCDFGWAEYCNGYFASGIFNLWDDSENTIFDRPWDQGKEHINYNKFLKTITYGWLE